MKWCIQITENNIAEVGRYYTSKMNGKSEYHMLGNLGYHIRSHNTEGVYIGDFNSDRDKCSFLQDRWGNPSEGYKEITIEEFDFINEEEVIYELY